MHSLTLGGLQAKGKAHQVSERDRSGESLWVNSIFFTDSVFRVTLVKKQFPLSLSVYKGNNFYLFFFFVVFEKAMREGARG